MSRPKLVSVSALALVAALAVAAPAGATVQVGSAGWNWGNPLPQGNAVRGLAFSGGSGYAVGDFGTILATGDGGGTWRGLVSGTLTRLTEVQAIDQDSLFAGGGCVGRRSDDGGQTFTRVAFTSVESSCRQPLAAAWFVNEQTGYLVLADGTTTRTDNDGQSFASRTPVPGTPAAGGPAKPTDVLFLDASTGLAATTGGKVYRTTDGANTWTLVADFGRTVRALTVVGGTLLVAGDQGLVRSSADGGIGWTAVDNVDTGAANLTGISCAAATLCVMTTADANGHPGNGLIRYDAAGTPAGVQVTPSGSPIAAAAFASPTRVVAAGDGGATTVSTDAGAAFTPVGGKLPGSSFVGLVAGPPNAAFAYGDNGAIAKTLNGGQTWSTASVPTSEALQGISFPTLIDGYALDDSGGLFGTADGGVTWRTLDTGTTSPANNVLALSPRVVLVVGPRVRRSVDAGASFAAATGAIAKRNVYWADAAGSTAFVYGSDSLWRSTNHGRSWKALPFPARIGVRFGHRRNVFAIERVDFLTATRGFLMGDGGRLFVTSNAGKRWTELFGAGSRRVVGMSFGDPSHGYLATIEGSGYTTLLRTGDGGRTWAPQVVVPSAIGQHGIAAGLAQTDYLLAGTNQLLWTTTGGEAGSTSSVTLSTPRTRLAKAGTITVSGRLKPAASGREVTVAYLAAGSSRWRRIVVKTVTSGSFTTSWKVGRGTSRFVAQWAGDERRAGDGSTVLTVTAGR